MVTHKVKLGLIPNGVERAIGIRESLVRSQARAFLFLFFPLPLNSRVGSQMILTILLRAPALQALHPLSFCLISQASISWELIYLIYRIYVLHYSNFKPISFAGPGSSHGAAPQPRYRGLRNEATRRMLDRYTVARATDLLKEW